MRACWVGTRQWEDVQAYFDSEQEKRENVRREAADHLSERSGIGDSLRRQALLENMPLYETGFRRKLNKWQHVENSEVCAKATVMLGRSVKGEVCICATRGTKLNRKSNEFFQAGYSKSSSTFCLRCIVKQRLLFYSCRSVGRFCYFHFMKCKVAHTSTTMVLTI